MLLLGGTLLAVKFYQSQKKNKKKQLTEQSNAKKQRPQNIKKKLHEKKLTNLSSVSQFRWIQTAFKHRLGIHACFTEFHNRFNLRQTLRANNFWQSVRFTDLRIIPMRKKMIMRVRLFIDFIKNHKNLLQLTTMGKQFAIFSYKFFFLPSSEKMCTFLVPWLAVLVHKRHNS